MMLPRYTRRFSSFALVCTVAAYWGISGDSSLVPEPKAPDADHVDSYLRGAQMLQFDQDGHQIRELSAAQVEHRTGSDSNHLMEPQMTLFSPSGRPPIVISADEAITTDHNSLIEMRSNVRVEPQSAPASHLDTEQLFLRPESNFAWTAEPVAYYQGDSTTRAVGMNAYFEQRKIELLSEVQGHYESR